MIADDAGPLDVFEVESLRPLPRHPNFESLTVDRLSGLDGVGAVLDGARQHVTGGQADALDGAYAATIAPAQDTAANAAASARAPSAIGPAVDNGDGTAPIFRYVSQFLPGVDTPIGLPSNESTDPPRPPPPRADRPPHDV